MNSNKIQNSKKNSKNQKIKDKLFSKKESSWKTYSKKEQKDFFFFCEQYKKFISIVKTEREFISKAEEMLKKEGYKPINEIKQLKKGDKVYKEFKKKSLIAFIVGKKKEEMRIIGSHVDSPRLDLKPSPLYEDSGYALLKSHYYGGIKKYHWVNTPLSMHGIIHTKEGKRIELNIGEKENEPKFIVPDLLPHLAKDQMERKASKTVEGEELNILIGNIPINDEDIKEQIKFTILKKLNEEYGIIEEDFQFAEIEFVPSNKPSDIGLDRSMISAYGQDDKVCAYTSLKALFDIKNPHYTTVSMFVDKEEIGSVGDTGAASDILERFVQQYARLTSLDILPSEILEKSKSLSADVTAGMNPNYKDVNDPKNVSYLGKGVSVEKYGGGGGKYSTNDAHAEYMAEIRKILDNNKIAWQTGEIGKIDVGGGGTIGMFMSRYGMDCVDAGPCLLGMHSPCEVSSKADIYSSYKLYKAFFESKK